ncbi:hypothetical protein Efla_006549 [Eimeria flavescens]
MVISWGSRVSVCFARLSPTSSLVSVCFASATSGPQQVRCIGAGFHTASDPPANKALLVIIAEVDDLLLDCRRQTFLSEQPLDNRECVAVEQRSQRIGSTNVKGLLLAEVDDLLLDCVCVVINDEGKEYSSSLRTIERIDFGVSWNGRTRRLPVVTFSQCTTTASLQMCPLSSRTRQIDLTTTASALQ